MVLYVLYVLMDADKAHTDVRVKVRPHLHIRPRPRISEMIYIDISSGEFLQGQLCLSVKIQDGLMLNEAGK